MKKIYFLLALCALTIAQPLRADEGMWLLPLIQKLNYATMQKEGLKMSAEEIYSINNSSLKDAVVIFGGGCTGEIISPEGLLLTNHHCGYGAIQQHSTVEHDYLKDGFWAMKRSDEIPSPDLAVSFLDRIEDVTAKVLPELASITDEQARGAKVVELSKTLTAEATNGQKGMRAVLSQMFNGNSYFLFVYKIYDDVRLVGAPPSSIGKFGADTDNWMWPRHTCDFSMFRVYTDKDGNPAAYSADNVPMKPKRYLNISIAGINEGDYAMIMGYPGRTNRYMTSWEVKQMMDVENETRIYIRGVRQDILLEDMLADPKIKIQYASKYSQSSNYWKNSIGMNRGLKRLHVIDKKAATEKQFTAFATTSNSEGYKSALNDIQTAIAGREKDLQIVQYYNEALRVIEIASIAGRSDDYLKSLQAKDKDEQAIEKNKTNLLKAADAFYKDYSMTTDTKVAKAMLKIFTTKVDKINWPTVLVEVDKKYKGNFDKYVEDMFAKSIFISNEKVTLFTNKPSAKNLEKDPAYQFAVSMREKVMSLNANMQSFNLQLTKGRRNFLAGLMEMQKDKTFYPDANFTTRLTYGNIFSYNPTDAVHYNYYTTLDGVMEKEDPNNWEFVVPEKLKALYNAKNFGPYAMPNGKMPVAFLSNNDITGGNSGSPVLNSKGELIGCAFDGNWEAMSGDIAFEPELQRTISVDIRYVLFIIDKYAGAKHLIDEMTIVKK